MSLSSGLIERSQQTCELCQRTDGLSVYTVPPKSSDADADQVVLCNICRSQIEGQADLDPNHWRCLNDSMWNPEPAVQVVAYRMLQRLNIDWANDLLNMMYMDEATKEWADTNDQAIVHKDSNGHVLSAGDTVVLIKDLNVKGGGFTAKRGTAVRRIRLVHDNAEHIEGKVDGQQIVILTKYVKKS